MRISVGFRKMVKSPKVEDRVIGKNKDNHGWKGRIISIDGSGRKRRFKIRYENGREKEETIRAFTNEGTFGASSACGVVARTDQSISDYSDNVSDDKSLAESIDIDGNRVDWLGSLHVICILEHVDISYHCSYLKNHAVNSVYSFQG